MEIPLWKQTMLNPMEYSEYANMSIRIIYEYCNKKIIPCIKTNKGFKIHRIEADKKLAEMALNHVGHTQRHRAELIEEPVKQRRRRMEL